MTPWNFRSSLLGILLMMVAAALIFAAFERHISAAWFALGVHPEVLVALETSLEDQKALADGKPEREAVYRQRFEDLQTLLRHLRVLAHNREGLVERYQQLLLLAFLGTVALLLTLHHIRQRRLDQRLESLRAALADLAQGRTDIELGERRRDLVGRISAMIEQTSRVMARDRRRLATLNNLSAWQEAARRHAHEMRTPLTGARLELSRLGNLLERESLDHLDDIRQAARSATQELEHLGRFAQECFNLLLWKLFIAEFMTRVIQLYANRCRVYVRFACPKRCTSVPGALIIGNKPAGFTVFFDEIMRTDF